MEVKKCSKFTNSFFHNLLIFVCLKFSTAAFFENPWRVLFFVNVEDLNMEFFWFYILRMSLRYVNWINPSIGMNQIKHYGNPIFKLQFF